MQDELAALKARQERRQTIVEDLVAVATITIAALILLVWWSNTIMTAVGRVDPAAYATDPVGTGGYLSGGVFGSALIQGAIVWAIAYFALLRRVRPNWGRPAFLTMVGMAFVASIISGLVLAGSVGGAGAFRVADAEINRAMAEAHRRPDTAPVELGPVRSTGQAAEYEAMVKEAAGDALRVIQRHEAAMAKADLAHASAALRRQKIPGDIDVRIARSRAALVMRRDVTARSIARLKAAAAMNPDPNSEAARLARDLEANFQGGAPADIEIRALDLLSEQVALFRRARGNWYADGGDFYFRRAEDLAEHNRLATAVRALGVERDRLKAAKAAASSR